MPFYEQITSTFMVSVLNAPAVNAVWVNRFEIRRELGAGGLGTVYEAFDRQRQELVALKTLRNLAPETLYSFKQEFRFLAEIRHPNLVKLGELFHDGHRWFFSMELVDGEDFFQYVRRPRDGSGFDEPRLRSALTQLVRGLMALHQVGLIHRDIKPSNLMLTSSGHLSILDFGLVTRQEDFSKTGTGDDALVGTALYMAPEQAQSQRVGPASDWYSVGVLLYQALSGRHPFEGAAIHVLYRKVVDDPPPLDDIPSSASDLAELAMALIERDPCRRPDGPELAKRLGISPEEIAPEVGPDMAGESRPPSEEFVGRHQEIQSLSDSLAKTDHCPQGVLVVGEAGVGKSILARRFLFASDHQNLLVLAGRCYRRESVPYNGLDGVIDGLTRYLIGLPDEELDQLLPPAVGLVCRLFPVLAGVGAVARRIEVVDDNAPNLRERAFEALGQLLTRIAHRRRLCLFIDDLQWADDESLHFLRHLTSRQAPAGLMLLATVRRSDDGTYGLRGAQGLQVLRDHTGDPDILELSNLNDDDTRRLIQTLWPDQQLPRLRLIERLVTETRGHPMMLAELVRHLSAQEPQTPGEGIRLTEVILARVEGLPPLERQLLDVASLSGIPIAAPLLGHILPASPGELHHAIDRLHMARLIRLERRKDSELIATYHGRIREAVLSAMSDEDQRQLHSSLADAYLDPDGESYLDDPLVLVDHLEFGGRPHLASTYAESAAHRAARAFAFDRAARLYQRALELNEGDDSHHEELLVARADMVFNSGRSGAAAELYLQAAARYPSGPQRRRLRRQAAEAFLIKGEVERGLELLESVLSESGLAIATSKTSLIASTLWHHWRLKRRGLAFLPRHPDRLDQADLERLELLSAASRQISFIDPLLGFNFRIRGLRLALELGHRPAIVEGIALEAVAESARGGWAAREVFEELLETAEQVAVTDAERAIVAGCRGSLLVFAGRPGQALTVQREATSQIEAHVTGSQRVTGRNRLLTWRVKTLYDLGRFNELHELYGELTERAERHGDILQTMGLHRIAGMLFALRGDPDRVAALLDERPLYPPLTTESILHWYDLRSRCELALYRRSVLDEGEELLSQIKEFRRTPFARRFQLARMEVRWSQARLQLALCAADDNPGLHREVEEGIADLRDEEKSSLASLWSDALEAGLRTVQQRPEQARALLHKIVTDADAQGLICLAGCARLRLANLHDTAQSRPDLSYFEDQGLIEPRRVADVFLPGSSHL